MPLTSRPSRSAGSMPTATDPNPRLGALVAGPIRYGEATSEEVAPPGSSGPRSRCGARGLAPDRPTQMTPAEAEAAATGCPGATMASHHDGREDPGWGLCRGHTRGPGPIVVSPNSELPTRLSEESPSSHRDVFRRIDSEEGARHAFAVPGSHCRPLPIERPRGEPRRLSVTARAVRRPRNGCVSANRLMGSHPVSVTAVRHRHTQEAHERACHGPPHVIRRQNPFTRGRHRGPPEDG
jgi:hypothetical protein